MCRLRARKPDTITKRLKALIFGGAGSGKTTAAIQFPNSYIIDCERGAENYARLINDAGGVVFQTTNFEEVLSEVRALLVEKHEYRTLVIDPFTTVFNDLLDKMEQKVGSEFGRHYGAANKLAKRLINMLYQLDMNVIITCHGKAEYVAGVGGQQTKSGITFDGYKQLDYSMDLVFQLEKKGKDRYARIVKSRLPESFPDDGNNFAWSYKEIRRRMDPSILERNAVAVELATPTQLDEVAQLLATVRLPEGTEEKWFSKANVDRWEDMPSAIIAKCIEYIRLRIPPPPMRYVPADAFDVKQIAEAPAATAAVTPAAAAPTPCQPAGGPPVAAPVVAAPAEPVKATRKKRATIPVDDMTEEQLRAALDRVHAKQQAAATSTASGTEPADEPMPPPKEPTVQYEPGFVPRAQREQKPAPVGAGADSQYA